MAGVQQWGIGQVRCSMAQISNQGQLGEAGKGNAETTVPGKVKFARRGGEGIRDENREREDRDEKCLSGGEGRKR